MITMRIRNGVAINQDDCAPKEPYAPSIGTVIKFIAEDGNEYHVITCRESAGYCYGCVFNWKTGHPLYEMFGGRCGPDITKMCCYDRTYKPLESVLENL